MSKSPKQIALLSHKLIVLADLMIESLDELGYDETHELYSNLKVIEQNSCKLIEAAFDVKNVRNSTYLGDLSKKVDTVIRKNFKEQC